MVGLRPSGTVSTNCNLKSPRSSLAGSMCFVFQKKIDLFLIIGKLEDVSSFVVHCHFFPMTSG